MANSSSTIGTITCARHINDNTFTIETSVDFFLTAGDYTIAAGSSPSDGPR